MAGNCHSLREAKMKHLAGEPRQSTCLTTDECRGWPDSRPQKVKAYYLWRKLAQAVDAIDRDTGTTLHDFWKTHIYQDILNIANAWVKMLYIRHCITSSCTVSRSHKILNMPEGSWYNCEARQAASAGDWCCRCWRTYRSHEPELSNEDLMELQVAEMAENTKDETDEVLWGFNKQVRAIAFCETASEISLFEKMNSNSPQFLKTNRTDDTMTCLERYI
jgi:hypothetical protein